MEQQDISIQEYEKVIDKINELLIKFDENLQSNLQVAMLVGNTGYGKSTLFNFLSGFEFQIKNEKKTNYLVLKNPNQEDASIMAYGMKSITKEPNYYFNQNNNHILIDFPGFNDTEGEVTQTLISILFNRLVIKRPIKIIYIIKAPTGELPSRGEDIKTFISKYFPQNTKDFAQITLLINYYIEDLDNQELISKVQEQIKVINKNSNKRIAVIPKIRQPSDIEEIFNEEKRLEIWKLIEQSNLIKFKPVQFLQQNTFSSFISEKCDQLTSDLASEICKQIDESLNKLKNKQIESLLGVFLQIEVLIQQDANQNVFGWYSELILLLQDITEIFNSENVQKNKKEINILLKIFKFVSQENDIINFKDFLKEHSQLIKSNLITQKQTILYKLIKFEKSQQNLDNSQQNNNIQELLNKILLRQSYEEQLQKEKTKRKKLKQQIEQIRQQQQQQTEEQREQQSQQQRQQQRQQQMQQERQLERYQESQQESQQGRQQQQQEGCTLF